MEVTLTVSGGSAVDLELEGYFVHQCVPAQLRFNYFLKNTPYRLGACLRGNGILIGASASVVVAGMAEKRGTLMTFVDFIKVCFSIDDYVHHHLHPLPVAVVPALKEK